MSKYVDMDKLKEMIEAKADTLIEGKQAFNYVSKWLDIIPSVDAVEVVRCKDCKWCMVENWDGEILYGCDCAGAMNDITPDSYCSCGERQKDGKL